MSSVEPTIPADHATSRKPAHAASVRATSSVVAVSGVASLLLACASTRPAPEAHWQSAELPSCSDLLKELSPRPPASSALLGPSQQHPTEARSGGPTHDGPECVITGFGERKHYQTTQLQLYPSRDGLWQPVGIVDTSRIGREARSRWSDFDTVHATARLELRVPGKFSTDGYTGWAPRLFQLRRAAALVKDHVFAQAGSFARLLSVSGDRARVAVFTPFQAPTEIEWETECSDLAWGLEADPSSAESAPATRNEISRDTFTPLLDGPGGRVVFAFDYEDDDRAEKLDEQAGFVHLRATYGQITVDGWVPPRQPGGRLGGCCTTTGIPTVYHGRASGGVGAVALEDTPFFFREQRRFEQFGTLERGAQLVVEDQHWDHVRFEFEREELQPPLAAGWWVKQSSVKFCSRGEPHGPFSHWPGESLAPAEEVAPAVGPLPPAPCRAGPSVQDDRWDSHVRAVKSVLPGHLDQGVLSAPDAHGAVMGALLYAREQPSPRDPTQVVHSDEEKATLVRLDGAGEPEWVRPLPRVDGWYTVSADENVPGHVRLVALYSGEVDLGGGRRLPNPGYLYKGLVAEFSDAGLPLWLRTFRGPYDPEHLRTSVVGDSIYLAWPTDVPNGKRYDRPGLQWQDALHQLWLEKLGPGGVIRYRRLLDTGTRPIVESMAFDRAGGLVSYSRADPKRPTRCEDRLVAIDASGRIVWRRPAAKGRLVLSRSGDVWLVAPNLPASYDYYDRPEGDGTLLVTRLRRSGAPVGSSTFCCGAVQAATELPDGSLVLAGLASGKLEYGTVQQPVAGSRLFVARVSAQGEALWAQTFGPLEPHGRDGSRPLRVIALHAQDGQVLVYGLTRRSGNLGPFELGPGLFVARIEPGGVARKHLP